MAVKIYNVSANRNFLKEFVKYLRAEYKFYDEDDIDKPLLSELVIFLPTNRVVRELSKAFLQDARGRALLLPKLIAIGSIDEGLFLLEEFKEVSSNEHFINKIGLNFRKTIGGYKRELIMLGFVKQLLSSKEQNSSTATIMKLVEELIDLLDNVYRFEVDLKNLSTLVSSEKYAKHWQDNLLFLKIIQEVWPQYLEKNKLMDEVQKWVQMVDFLGEYYKNNTPSYRIIFAGYSGAIPVIARLIKSILKLDNSCVIMSELDTNYDLEQLFLNDKFKSMYSHPQYNLHLLCHRIDISPSTISELNIEDDRDTSQDDEIKPLLEERCTLIRSSFATQVMYPLELAVEKKRLAEVYYNEFDSTQDEAIYLAMLMRYYLEEKNKIITLITPNMALAQIVQAELMRWNIQIDNSAGQSLGISQVGIYIRLILLLLRNNFDSLSVISLLKHKFFLSKWSHKDKIVNYFDIATRGLANCYGLDGLLEKSLNSFAEMHHVIRDFTTIDDVEESFCGLVDYIKCSFLGLCEEYVNLKEGKTNNPLVFFEELLRCAESLSNPVVIDNEVLDFSSHNKERANIGDAELLYSSDSGQSLAELFKNIFETLANFEDLDMFSKGNDWISILEEWLSREVFRSKYDTHPRLFISGVLEARLMKPDVVLIGDLNESSWPPNFKVNPWLNPEMAQKLGLPSPYEKMSQAAHDFVCFFCSPRVHLTRSKKAGKSPTIKSRWLQRLESHLPAIDYSDINEIFSENNKLEQAFNSLQEFRYVSSYERPCPNPPLDMRPHQLSVTAVERFRLNPYDTYARFVLGLKKLDTHNKESDVALFGSWIHKILEVFDYSGAASVKQNQKYFKEVAQEFIGDFTTSSNEKIMWVMKLDTFIYKLLTNLENDKRSSEKIWKELSGEWILSNGFRLTGTADRVDLLQGGTFKLIDYKTGNVPSNLEVLKGLYIQLPLLANMLLWGSMYRYYGASLEDVKMKLPILKGDTSLMEYWEVKTNFGRREIRSGSKEVEELEQIKQLINNTRINFENFINEYIYEQRPFIAYPLKESRKIISDYEQLSRKREWDES